jgi:hypothetical protein
MIIVTLPIGSNPVLDKLLKEKIIQFSEQYYLKRISKKDNEWKETSWKDVQDTKYDHRFSSAYALVIGMIYDKPLDPKSV